MARLKGRRVDGKKLRRLKASIPLLYVNSNELYSIRHFDVFTAGSIHLKKPSGGPKGLSVPHAMGPWPPEANKKKVKYYKF